MSHWSSSAPSNIALIKYMGKTDTTKNIPTNSSLSLTLEKLRTYVEVSEVSETGNDKWQPLEKEGVLPINLTEKAQHRFLTNWQRLKDYFKIEGRFLIESASNFPADCGIASSASSFAALTKVAYKVAQDKGQQNKDLTLEQLAQLSRGASGSSCRSFFGPFCEWSEQIVGMTSAYDPLFHFVVIVDGEPKKLSSSQAHMQVTTSELFKGRPERAERRLGQVKTLLREKNLVSWCQLYELCWQEFWDMHALFETSSPSFGYMATDSVKVLNLTRGLWETLNDGPVVTMDAGSELAFFMAQ